MVNTKLHIDWSKVEPCEASDLEEYWAVNKFTLEMSHHVRSGGSTRADGKRYFFCTSQYSDPNSIDLCEKCCKRLGLLW